MRYLLLLIILINPAWCLAGVNLDWYESVSSSSSYSFHIEFDSDTDWTDGYTIGGNDYSAGDSQGSVTGSPTRDSVNYISSPTAMSIDWIENFLFTNTSNDILDGDELYVRINIYIPLALTAGRYLMQGDEPTNGRIRFRLNADRTLLFERRDTAGTTVLVNSSDIIPLATWTQIDYRFSQSIGSIEVRVGNGPWSANSTSISALTVDIENIYVGSVISTTDTFIMDDISIWKSYTEQ